MTQACPTTSMSRRSRSTPRTPTWSLSGPTMAPTAAPTAATYGRSSTSPTATCRYGRSSSIRPSRSTVFVGTAPLGVYRSDDGGDQLARAGAARLPARCEMGFAPRVMRLAIDPENPDVLYAPMEVNGVMRSSDGGESWQDCSAGLVKPVRTARLEERAGQQMECEGMLDVHALCVTPAAPGTLLSRCAWASSAAKTVARPGGHGDQALLAAQLWPRRAGVAAGPARPLCLPQRRGVRQPARSGARAMSARPGSASTTASPRAAR